MHNFPPDANPLAVSLIQAMLPLIKDSQAEVLNATADFDLSLSQVRMLFVLAKTPDALPIHALAEQVYLSMAAAGRAADALVRAGLLSRQEDTTDRRIKRIRLTDAGEQAVEQIGAARVRSMNRFVDRLDDAERATLAELAASLSALTRKYFPMAVACPPPSTTDTSS